MFKRKRQKNLAIIALAIAYMLWGLNTVAIKINVDNMPVPVFMFARFAAAAIILYPLTRRHFKKLKFKIYSRIIVASLIGLSLNILILGEGLKRTSAINAALICLMGPIWMYVLSIGMLKEKFNAKILFGLIVALVGTCLVVAEPILLRGSTIHDGSLVGNLIVFVAVFIDVLGTIIIKPILRKVPPIQMTTLRFSVVAVSMLPVLYYQNPHISDIHLSQSVVLAFAYSLLVCTVVLYVAYHWALGRISGEESSTLHYLDPLFGVVGAIVILGDQLTPIILLGGGLTALGVYLSEVKVKHKYLHIHMRK